MRRTRSSRALVPLAVLAPAVLLCWPTAPTLASPARAEQEPRPAVVRFQDAGSTVGEGESVRVVLERVDRGARAVTVRLVTRAGTAGTGDVEPVAHEVTFAPGQRLASVTVTALLDGAREGTETCTLALVQAQGVTVAHAVHHLQITDADGTHPVGPVLVPIAPTDVRTAGPGAAPKHSSGGPPAGAPAPAESGDRTAVPPPGSTSAPSGATPTATPAPDGPGGVDLPFTSDEPGAVPSSAVPTSEAGPLPGGPTDGTVWAWVLLGGLGGLLASGSYLGRRAD